MISELWRGVHALTVGFGSLPIVCRRAAERQKDGGRAIDELVEYAARMRKRFGVEVEVHGRENIPTGIAYVMTPNQQSIIDDIGIFDALVPHLDLRVLAAEYGRVPFVREGVELSGGVFLERGNRAATDAALSKLTDAARAGSRVGIWPEGKLSPDGEVGRFKRGAFLVAIGAQVPVLPVATDGGRAILAPGALRMRPGTLRFSIGASISTEGLTENDALALAERVRGVVQELQAELRTRAQGRA